MNVFDDECDVEPASERDSVESDQEIERYDHLCHMQMYNFWVFSSSYFTHFACFMHCSFMHLPDL